jgi:hypothetical protein
MTHRPLNEIATEITQLWAKPYFGAIPHILAMRSIRSVTEDFGYDSGESVVLYFLANASTWRGDDARRIKAELKAIVK